MICKNVTDLYVPNSDTDFVLAEVVVDLENVVEYPEENYTEEEKCVLQPGMIPKSQDGTKYKELLNSLGINGMSKEEIVSNLENLVGGYNYFKSQKPKFVESKDMPMLATNNIISAIMYNHLINNCSIAKLSNHFKMDYSVVSRVVCEWKRKYRVEYQRRKILTKGRKPKITENYVDAIKSYMDSNRF